jgi:GT2 family glycosyltransferase
MVGDAGHRPDLSIIFGTYNRFDALKQTVEMARASARPLAVEFVIADGGSTDHTKEYLRQQRDVTLIEQHELLGACNAFNACADKVRAPVTAHLNDDALCLGDCLYQAHRYLTHHPEVGQVALGWRDADSKDPRYKTGRILDRYYANFGVVRTWLGHHVGWFSGPYKTYECDQEFSFKIWEQGYQVVLLGGCRLLHLRVRDELRAKWRHDHGEPVTFLGRWRDKVRHFPDAPVITEEEALRCK